MLDIDVCSRGEKKEETIVYHANRTQHNAFLLLGQHAFVYVVRFSSQEGKQPT